MQTRLKSSFLYSCAALLFLTSVAKLVSLKGSDRLLLLADPLFGIPNRDVMLFAGIFEIFIVASLVSPINSNIKCGIAAVSGGIFLAYRAALLYLGFSGWCSCLGSFGQFLFFEPSAQSWFLTSVGFYQMVGGILFLYFSLPEPTDQPTAASSSQPA